MCPLIHRARSRQIDRRRLGQQAGGRIEALPSLRCGPIGTSPLTAREGRWFPISGSDDEDRVFGQRPTRYRTCLTSPIALEPISMPSQTLKVSRDSPLLAPACADPFRQFLTPEEGFDADFHCTRPPSHEAIWWEALQRNWRISLWALGVRVATNRFHSRAIVRLKRRWRT